MGSFKPGTDRQEGNVNNSMILKMNAETIVIKDI